jgi:hypothetical protein
MASMRPALMTSNREGLVPFARIRNVQIDSSGTGRERRLRAGAAFTERRI